MMYTVTGRYRRKQYTVEWNDGKLRGTDFIKTAIRANAEALEGRAVGPVGQYTTTKHLKDPLSALFVMLDFFDEITEVTGDAPEAEAVPEGRIG